MRNGHAWLDRAGRPLQAHGGWILPCEERYLWYGEDYDNDGTCRGIHLYSSADLATWEDLGLVLAAEELRARGYQIVERPRVIRDSKNGRAFLWMHVDDASYQKAELAVAVAERPEGPFRIERCFRPGGEDSRDFTLWETGGKLYLISSSEGNGTLHVWRVSSGLDGVEGEGTRILEGQRRESPCAFDAAGTHFLLTSGCTGWSPNAALVACAKDPFGPWELIDNPCVSDAPTPDPHETFGGQVSCVFLADGRPVALVDHWFPRSLAVSGYSLLAIEPSHARHPRVRLRWSDDSFYLGASVRRRSPYRAIVLTDTANEADDQFALAYTLLCPSIEVRAVVAGHFGLPRSARASFDEAARVMDLLGASAARVPLYQGAEGPLDSLGDVSPMLVPGVRAILDEAWRDDPRPLYLLGMGALTDAALALRQDPGIAGRLTLVWVGGGRYPGGGHEANLFRDVKAAQEVFASDIPIWQIPIGTYKELQVSLAELRRRVEPLGALGSLLVEGLLLFQERMRRRASWIPEEGWVLGDLAAPGVLLDQRRDLHESVQRPSIGDDGSYLHASEAMRSIRVYQQLDARFLIEDLIAKLAEMAEQERSNYA